MPGSLAYWKGIHNWKNSAGAPNRVSIVIEKKSEDTVLIFREGKIYEVNESDIEILEDKISCNFN